MVKFALCVFIITSTQVWGAPNQELNTDPTARTIDREAFQCYPKSCKEPLNFNLATCQCECKQLDCELPKVLNDDTCECECLPAQCTHPKILNPTTCKCDCPDCPPGSVLDSNSCDCVGVCSQRRYRGSDYCAMVRCKEDPSRTCALTANGICDCPPGDTSSCREITDPGICNKTDCPDSSLKCKFYHSVNPSTGQTGCQCDDTTSEDCCVKHPSAPSGVDCTTGIHGSDDCNAAANGACEWRCDCSDIDDHEICIRSTCKDLPTVRCEYSTIAGCSCPNSIEGGCCIDHPKQSNFFDCSTLESYGSRRCNQEGGGETCQWICSCNQISNQKACESSTCLSDPKRRCRFNTSAGVCFCN